MKQKLHVPVRCTAHHFVPYICIWINVHRGVFLTYKNMHFLKVGLCSRKQVSPSGGKILTILILKTALYIYAK